MLATAFPIGLERQGYIAVSIMFVTRNARRPEWINNGNLQCREGGLPAGDIAAGMICW